MRKLYQALIDKYGRLVGVVSGTSMIQLCFAKEMMKKHGFRPYGVIFKSGNNYPTRGGFLRGVEYD